MNPDISVIICTYNRCNYLELALRSLENQNFERSAFEIIIIDAGSTDNTLQTIKTYSEIMSIQFIESLHSGLSDARNTGIKKASGKIVAFLDDDAIADPDWLRQILGCFHLSREWTYACGGKSLLICDTSLPSWLNSEMLIYLGQFDFGNIGFVMDTGEQNPAGLNMAFKNEIFKRIGYFNPNLGRKGGNLLSNEEVDFFHKMRKEGYKIWYNPKMLVYHHVTNDRLSKRYIINRFYWQGRSDAVMNAENSGIPMNGITEILRIILRFKNPVIAFISSVFSRDESKMIESRCRIEYNLGCLREVIAYLFLKG